MSGDLSEKLARLLGADEYEDLKAWWREDKYKKKRRAWFAGGCLALALFILTMTTCGSPDAGDPDDGPPSTLVE
jgi:hypothetical protein